MVLYLKHTAIDKKRWDECIYKSLNRRVYAFSWYLDIVCPDWDALVDDDYSCVFPLTHNRKWTISYLYQPYFAQQLGMFSSVPLAETRFNEFLRFIPTAYRFIEIQLNSKNNFSVAIGKSTQRINHELDITPDYNILAGNYSQNTKRNIRKAREMGIYTGREVTADELINLFRENFGEQEGKLHVQHYEALQKIILYGSLNGIGYIQGAWSKTGVLMAAAFFLFDPPGVYFLFAGSAPVARENGAMFMLIDRFITENAGKGLVLDFEGGNDPNLGRFYKSFGAAEVPYPALRINHLSILSIRWLYFIRKLRKKRKLATFVRI